MNEGAIETVVFDWDGTLVDSKRVLVASFQETTREVLGSPFPTEHVIDEFPQLLELAGVAPAAG